MLRHLQLLCLITTLLIASSLEQGKPDIPTSSSESLASPIICVIVRTFWGHGDGGSSELRDLLTSLQAQEITQ
jgi:hypothetical protein